MSIYFKAYTDKYFLKFLYENLKNSSDDTLNYRFMVCAYSTIFVLDIISMFIREIDIVNSISIFFGLLFSFMFTINTLYMHYLNTKKRNWKTLARK